LGRLLPGNPDRRCPSAFFALWTECPFQTPWQLAVTSYVRFISRKRNTLNIPGVAGLRAEEQSQDVRLAEMIGPRTAVPRCRMYRRYMRSQPIFALPIRTICSPDISSRRLPHDRRRHRENESHRRALCRGMPESLSGCSEPCARPA
jgi:hypothetical protein